MENQMNDVIRTFDQIEAQRLQLERAIKENFADPGALGLSPLLEAKRVKYGIPNSAWSNQAAYNKILVWQIPLEESDTYGQAGVILKTDARKGKELTEAPRGVIVSAGLRALDELRSNGLDLGHTIYFTHLAPYRLRLPMVAGKEPTLVILHSGDVFASEDLASSLKSGECKIVAKDNADGVTEHFYCDANGKTWKPTDTDIPEDG